MLNISLNRFLVNSQIWGLLRPLQKCFSFSVVTWWLISGYILDCCLLKYSTSFQLNFHSVSVMFCSLLIFSRIYSSFHPHSISCALAAKQSQSIIEPFLCLTIGKMLHSSNALSFFLQAYVMLLLLSNLIFAYQLKAHIYPKFQIYQDLVYII